MKNIIDLHIHSNFSEDADLDIKEIFKTASESSIKVISITDHDSIDSIKISDSIKESYPVQYVPGTELTTVFNLDGSQQHILGYFVNNKSVFLLDTLEYIKKLRFDIGKKRNNALVKLGFALDEDRIWKMTGNRPPTATSTILEVFRNEKNTTDKRLQDYYHGSKKDKKIMEFYREYFTEGSPAYVPFKSISTEEGIQVIKKSGGIPVLAHPVFLKDRNWLDNIKNMGIEGIEAISTYHNDSDIEFYIDYAEKNSLLITSGSDFHGPTSKPKIQIGSQKASSFEIFNNLIKFYNNRK